MFCANCGKACHPNAVMCVNCGVMLNNSNATQQMGGGIAAPNQTVVSPNDTGGFLWGFLGFVLSMFTAYIVPLVLYLLWKDEYPKRAKAVLKGMLVEVIVATVLAVIIVALVVVFYIVVFGVLVSGGYLYVGSAAALPMLL